ncbi:bifunctional pyr operon transcriptional regulator/uracil phosphoribosyltransferase PyrR [Candidatus Desulfovibrio trichonymphae]|uniref:Bifunctional protein PyrR n=1 Tax=Candidatus Desulfovibrio trichonymphae TaxID=1725232 RepID=A0A1J1E1Y8_9BACT|nr:bifunctional pyr operon transcriptional regulator/uracil phosphoribosyltransferase PyrR [Candidatus Desulfovibrio trichonymphae]BAV91891.1 bifunctional pyrimidine operon regulator PyrR/ uracil phosphoribosyltransferase [Candidatus Desulfovibrio trichonymphae]GHU92770.1 bifunctional protein PyrR [Deltaproteobacteria bacterium]GHU98979.1 bifunctional protein PyrR [Deltaproteobacteria bacterium]
MTVSPLLDKHEIARILDELAAMILKGHPDCGGVMLVGVQRRGADLARRLAVLLERRIGRRLPLGTLDINLYRDDWTSIEGKPQIVSSSIPESVDMRVVILVDDVLFTGRTVRAALEALLDYGRPDAVELLALIDRGHRELPIQADYAGRVVATERHEHVDVLLEERDGEDAVRLVVL